MENEFDDWRSKYDTMSSSEQVQYYNEIEELYPEQAHYNYENVKIVLNLGKKNADVLEFGTWKADLCETALNEFELNCVEILFQWIFYEFFKILLRNLLNLSRLQGKLEMLILSCKH
jgi:hypothetical protein